MAEPLIERAEVVALLFDVAANLTRIVELEEDDGGEEEEEQGD